MERRLLYDYPIITTAAHTAQEGGADGGAAQG